MRTILPFLIVCSLPLTAARAASIEFVQNGWSTGATLAVAFSGQDADGDMAMAGAAADGEPSKASAATDFQKFFWENRGDLNRKWKKRRKTALKERRNRENRARAARAI